MTRNRRLILGDTVVEYRVTRSTRRKKTLGIRVAAGIVEVAAPARTPIGEIEDILRRRGNWLLEKLEAECEQPAPPGLVTGDPVPFLGAELCLAVDEDEIRRSSARRNGDNLVIVVPSGLDGEERRESVRAAVLAWYRVQLGEFLAGRVAHWLPVMGRTETPSVLVREQRSRWGSCSADGTLRFSWRLAMLDPGLVDSVVVHELAHLEVMDHSPAFWKVVLRVMPDAKERRRRLNDAGRSLLL